MKCVCVLRWNGVCAHLHPHAPSQELSLAAVETCISLVERELAAREEEDDAPDAHEPVCAIVAPALLPVLFGMLPMVDDAGDENARWGRSEAAACAVQGFAQLLPDVTLPAVAAFTSSTLSAADWKHRHAAALALGAAASAEGEEASALLMEALPLLVDLFSVDDDSPAHTVATSAAWAIRE